MRGRLLASCLLILATAAGIASTGALSIQVSGAAGSWSKAASPITGREEHTATLLRNGNVLIAGGTDGRGKTLASAEVYNPATNRWTPAGPMLTARLDHTATLLQSGKVLVAGGLEAAVPFVPSSPLASAELYDPTTNAWSPAAPMIGSRARQTSTLLVDGRVLVVGGLSVALRESGFFPGQPTTAEIYDPKVNRWLATAPMVSYRLDQTATLLTDGRVLTTGGQRQDDFAIFNSTEIYDARQDRWVEAAPLAVGRLEHAATLLANGDVLVAGGLGEEPNSLTIALTSAEIYDPRVNRWSPVAGMAEVHADQTATLLRNGMVLLMGARAQSRPELYDPARNKWSSTGPSMFRYKHTATRLPDGKVLIVGGYALKSLDSVLVYDPNGVAPMSRQPLDPRLIAGLLLAALLLVAGIALSFPAVRRRLKGSRRHGELEDWIT
jgi:N-acetylneuraminic acid mutarotase